jgi:hypothetical protein
MMIVLYNFILASCKAGRHLHDATSHEGCRVRHEQEAPPEFQPEQSGASVPQLVFVYECSVAIIIECRTETQTLLSLLQSTLVFELSNA